jgi:hypothetical protein
MLWNKEDWSRLEALRRDIQAGVSSVKASRVSRVTAEDIIARAGMRSGEYSLRGGGRGKKARP